ncbi:MAG: hypothetical protein PHQ28_16165, partial [Mycobacterium sp.]|nr:hypothetical protein [Mycobacterium sp.]
GSAQEMEARPATTDQLVGAWSAGGLPRRGRLRHDDHNRPVSDGCTPALLTLYTVVGRILAQPGLFVPC